MSEARLFTESQGEWELFRWDATTWHTPSVIAAAWASDISYPREGRSEHETDEHFRARFHALGFQSAPIHLGGGIDAYLIAREYTDVGPRIGIIVRGSQMTREDWRTNGRIKRVEAKFLPLGGRGHRGFIEGGVEVGEAALQELKGWGIDIRNARQTRYAGHSQGGAVAQAVGEYLLHTQRLDPATSMVYSYSAPRVWHADAEPELNHLRIFHEYDFVPLGPPLLLGYRHRGTAELIRDNATRAEALTGWQIAGQRVKTVVKLAVTGAAFAPARIALVVHALWRGAKSHSVGDRMLPILRRLSD